MKTRIVLTIASIVVLVPILLIALWGVYPFVDTTLPHIFSEKWHVSFAFSALVFSFLVGAFSVVAIALSFFGANLIRGQTEPCKKEKSYVQKAQQQ